MFQVPLGRLFIGATHAAQQRFARPATHERRETARRVIAVAVTAAAGATSARLSIDERFVFAGCTQRGRETGECGAGQHGLQYAPPCGVAHAPSL